MRIKTKQYKRRLTVFGGLSCLVIVLFIYHLISYIVLVSNLTRQEEELQKKLLDLKKNNIELKEEIQKLKDPEYLAKYAQEKFLYSKDGQYIIRIDENDNIVVELNLEDVRYRKVMIYILGLAIMSVLIYFIVRIRKRSLE